MLAYIITGLNRLEAILPKLLKGSRRLSNKMLPKSNAITMAERIENLRMLFGFLY